MRDKIINSIFFLLFIIYVYELIKYINSPLILNYENADILINYYGGFIRRGFLGSIFLYLEFTGINPILFARILIIISFFSICSIFIYYFKKYNIDLRALLFPFFLPYLLLCNMLGFRDFILLNLLYFSLRLYNKVRIIYTILGSIIIIIGILIHEMFIFYSFFSVILLGICRDKKHIIKSILFIFPSLIAFIFVFFNSGGSQDLPSKMYESIIVRLPKYSIVNNEIPNSILALQGKLTGHIEYVFQLNNLGFSRGLVYIGFIGFLFVFLYNFKLFSSSYRNFKILSIIFITSILSSLPIYYAAMDWQRFIYMSFITTFLIYFNLTIIENKSIINFIDEIYIKFEFLKINSKSSLLILSLFFMIPYIELGKHPYLFSNSLLIIYSYISKLILQ